MSVRARRLAALVLAFAAGACARRPAPPSSLSCEALQRRAEQCEGAALGLVRRSLLEGDGGRADAAQQLRMFESRFREKLRGQTLQAQCERFRDDPSQADRRAALEVCSRASDCDAFVRCLFEQ